MYQFAQNISVFLLKLGFNHQQLWLLGLLLFFNVVATIAAFKYITVFILSSLEKHFKSGHFALWLNVFDRLNNSWIITSGLYAASLVMPFPGSVNVSFTILYIFICVVYAITIIKLIIEDSITIYFHARGNASDAAIKTVTNFVNVVDTLLLWTIAVIIFLRTINIDPQALINGLGIAGIVVAFSFQSALRDIFAFFTLYLDRSFAVGDYIEFGKFAGTIKEIRLRNTRLKALKGNELIVSNYELTNTVIENYDRMQYRRVSFVVKLRPDVSAETIGLILADIRDIFKRNDIADRVTFNTAVFDQLSETGIQLKIIYRFHHVDGDKNFYRHLEYKEKIDLRIKEILEERGAQLIQVPLSINAYS